jgi:hypothetical protein
MPRGGKRIGAGAKKGVIRQETRDKAMAREALRAIVDREMEALVSAQIKHALGLKYLVARHKLSGKFDKLSESEAEKLLSGGESDRVVIEVWEKDPSVQAFSDLMNRALDKPIDQTPAVAVTGTLKVIWGGD